MTKPTTLKDLLAGNHIDTTEIRKIARELFDGKTTGAGPDGYVVTSVAFDDLDDRLQQYVVKAILEFPVENVLDSHSDEDENEIDESDEPVRGSDDIQF